MESPFKDALEAAIRLFGAILIVGRFVSQE
jgi:hypothetical protein